MKGLARTRLAKSVHHAGWSVFVSMLEYNAALYGRQFRRIGRFEPTSQLCSACGVKDGPKPLHVRECPWRQRKTGCPGCRRRSGKPQRRRVTRHRLNPPPSGGRARQTWESGIHAYLKRAALNRSLFGSREAHRRRLAGRYSSPE